MNTYVSILVDFGSSLALVALLALGYGALKRRFRGPNAAPMMLGLLFGIVTIVQMHSPLSPMDGLIIDMRNVPIALAGAFLGFRGLIICLTLAAATRFGIGGVGWLPGVISMFIAGFAGLIWAHFTRHIGRRDLWHLILLGAAMSSHVVAAVFLPFDMALWVFSVAAPPLILLNLIAVPLVAALLEREVGILGQEMRLEAAARADMETEVLTRAAFAREIMHTTVAGATDPVVGPKARSIRSPRAILQKPRRGVASSDLHQALFAKTETLRHAIHG